MNQLLVTRIDLGNRLRYIAFANIIKIFWLMWYRLFQVLIETRLKTESESIQNMLPEKHGITIPGWLMKTNRNYDQNYRICCTEDDSQESVRISIWEQAAHWPSVTDSRTPSAYQSKDIFCNSSLFS